MTHGYKVVVADSDPAVGALLTEWLDQLGHSVDVVTDGRELVATCLAAAPDLVISDLRMPGMDGLTAAAVLRTNLSIPVVLTAAHWEPDLAARAAALGVPRVDKPLHPLPLVAAIAEAYRGPAGPAGPPAPPPADVTDGVAILHLAPDGRVTHWNRGAAALFGYEAREVVGRSWCRLFTPADRMAGVPAHALGAEAGRGVCERWLVRKDGAEFWAGGVLTALRGPAGRVVGYGAIVYDRTDAKRRETALAAQVAALEAVDENRMSFLATLAHELRNQIGPLLNYTAILSAVPDAGAARVVGGKVAASLRQMGRLVEDLMDAARVCQGKVRLDRQMLDLRAVLEQAAEQTAPACTTAGHKLSVDLPAAPVWVDADPDRLGQVAVNLLANAVKYTPTRGRITAAVETADGHAVLRVRDTGAGIAAGRLAAVFDLFTQEDDHREHAHGGLGVGLAVVRELVTLHGGRVEARSDGPGRGSEFVVRLPLAGTSYDPDPEPAEAAAGESGEHYETRVAPLRVLIVDDDIGATRAAAKVLAAAGHRVRVAAEAGDGVRQAAAEAADVVLIAPDLSDVSGRAVARLLRGVPGMRGATLAAFGGPPPGHADGFDLYLAKPLDAAGAESLRGCGVGEHTTAGR